MATDNTPPRLKLIVTIAVITIVTLIGLDFVFRGYMAFMTDMAMREKSSAPADLIAQHDAEKAAFAKAKLPLDQAIAQITKGTRDESIAPRPSDDHGPMVGWTKLPKQAPLPGAAGAHDAHDTLDLGDAGAVADAGAHETTATLDGGAGRAPHAAASDAGAGAHVEHGKVHTDGGKVGH